MAVRLGASTVFGQCLASGALGAPAVRYESPAKAPQLPASFRRELLRAGCRIPQAAFKSNAWNGGIENAIVGRFARAGQRDWAAVCSSRGISRVMIHWGGSARCPALPDRWTDADTVGVTDSGQTGYLLAIDPLTGRGIEAFATRLDEPPPPRRGHGGIAVVALTKGTSVSKYCERGRWSDLPGMD